MAAGCEASAAAILAQHFEDWSLLPIRHCPLKAYVDVVELIAASRQLLLIHGFAMHISGELFVSAIYVQLCIAGASDLNSSGAHKGHATVNIPAGSLY